MTGPRVCPREGDNRPELRLAAATKVGFDSKKLADVVAHTLDKTLPTTLLAVIFATFHMIIVQTIYNDDTVQKRNSRIIHKLIVYP